MLFREAGPVVPLSQSAWSLSFAKYLDLRFHATSYHRSSSSCRHSLHSEHFQFFAFGHTVAAFKLAPIKVREICSPSPFISMYQNKCLPERHELIEIVKVVAVKGHNVFATISDHLTTFQNAEMEKLDERLQTLIAACRSEKQMFKDRLECLQVTCYRLESLSTSVLLRIFCAAVSGICMSFASLPSHMAEPRFRHLLVVWILHFVFFFCGKLILCLRVEN